jgi:hypothetical protein
MVGLSLVKTDLSTPLHVRIQDPLNNEKGPFNTTNFTKRNCKVVLSGKKRACAGVGWA